MQLPSKRGCVQIVCTLTVEATYRGTVAWRGLYWSHELRSRWQILARLRAMLSVRVPVESLCPWNECRRSCGLDLLSSAAQVTKKARRTSY
jgi:hypothetical protein